MASRTRARRRAVELLYEADIKAVPASSLLTEDDDEFTRSVVEGVETETPQIDRMLNDAAEDWTVDRMAAVDRAVLRAACFELLQRPDVPEAAVIDEAVAAAKELSTAESGRFVNGVLGNVVRS